MLVNSVMTIGAILAVNAILFGFIFLKSNTKNENWPYAVSILTFAIGLIALIITTVTERTVILGAGLGGWGIACLFAAGIGFLVTSVSHALKVHD